MSTVGARSLVPAGVRGTRGTLLAGATLALVALRGVSAAEPPVTVEYQSAFADYRHFDAQAPAVEWRQANAAIRDGTEGAAHEMHSTQAPMETGPSSGDGASAPASPASDAVAPHGGHAPPPATPGENQAHHQ